MAAVEIAPQPGGLEWMEGHVPHPKGGEVRVAVRGRECHVELPAGVTGRLTWRGKVSLL